MVAVILSMAILLVLPSFRFTEVGSSEDLEQSVRNELGKYVQKSLWYDWEDIIYTEIWLICYDVPGKGIIDMGKMGIFQPLEDFLKDLASKPDPHAYIKNLKENLENPKQYPNATFGGGDGWDNVSLLSTFPNLGF